MTEEPSYKKSKHGYDKDFNNKMTEFKSIAVERNPTIWDGLVNWMELPHKFSRVRVIFVGSVIVFLATPEFEKLILASGVPAFLKNYGTAVLAGAALFVLTRSDRK